jgi:hypothetical protein
MTIEVTYKLNPQALRTMLVSPSGPAGVDLLRRGNNVRNQALRNMRSMGIGRKTGTGTLAGSIVVEMFSQPGGMLGVRIGSRLKYAIFVHEGHGVIVPVRARVLRWPAISATGRPRRRYQGGQTARYVFAKRVGPYPGRPFLAEALSAAAD